MDISKQLAAFQAKAKTCTVCRSLGLLHEEGGGRRAYPVLQQTPLNFKEVVAVMEAPNWDDTYNPRKGYITCDPGTDETGKFLFEMLKSINLAPSNVILTNAVLCLPITKHGKNKPGASQLTNCSRWLAELVDAVGPKVIVTFGAVALDAVNRIEKHHMSLRQALGRVVPWRGRKMLALAHPSPLGRANRVAELQMQDIKVLQKLL